MFSEKGKKLLVVNSYKFRFHKNLAEEKQRWACTDRKCKAFLKTDCRGVIIDDEHAHNHQHEPLSENILARQRISNSVKRKAEEDPTERPQKLIRIELDSSALELLDASDLGNVRHNIYRARRKLSPPLPKTLEELHNAIDTIDMTTKLGEDFLLVNDYEDHIVIFSTKKNMMFLSKCETILVDGTFYSCPSLFYQLFTVHGYKNGHYVQLAFCLLQNKEEATYEATFWHLRTYLPPEYYPATIFIDFEQAIHGALGKVWPKSSLAGCRFHLGQSWNRKIQKLGLQSTYQKQGSICSFLRNFYGLPFLRPEEIEDFIYSDFSPLAPTDANVDKFVEFVLEYCY